MAISTPRSRSFKPIVLAFAAAFAWPLHAGAAVDLTLADGESAAVRISIKDPTRLRVEGAQIIDLVGAEVHSEENPLGRLKVSSNERGDVFVQPTDPAMPATSLFVSTANATYTLVLAPAGIPADTIRITPSIGSAGIPAVAAENTRLPNHEKALVMLMRAIAADEVPPYIQVHERNVPVALWEQTDFTLIREYRGHPRWRLEAYLLTNRSSERLVIDEREFVRRGVVAVGLEQAVLAPGQSAVVRIAYNDEVL
ncbi:type-F conjugative transfer system secretin TraK [Thauera butanivorans]|uniref:type-F conjugative transfer system secretin TraK n=1 Tax=Thauera butanivorans TaxID=86174 RepID=UPI000838DACF|nr:type-F conjugative transfer system secretin TraK [Thauera butanivorans]